MVLVFVGRRTYFSLVPFCFVRSSKGKRMPRFKMTILAGLMTVANCFSLNSFSGMPIYQGKVGEVWLSKTPGCSYLGFEVLNAADNTTVRMAIPISGGTWTGSNFTTEADANRYTSLLLTAKSMGVDVRGKVLPEQYHKWVRCSDNIDFFVPEYLLVP
jgi:hypothetical protein